MRIAFSPEPGRATRRRFPGGFRTDLLTAGGTGTRKFSLRRPLLSEAVYLGDSLWTLETRAYRDLQRGHGFARFDFHSPEIRTAFANSLYGAILQPQDCAAGGE